MKAMVFAAGIGSRLKPWTDHHPKALAEVGGVPLLERVLQRVRSAGISDVVVNVHHFAGQIIDFLEANDNFGLNIAISDESSLLLDTGGALVHARSLLADSDAIVVHNADIYTDAPLCQMVVALRDSDAVLLTQERPTKRYLLFDKDRRMHGWTNISTEQVRPAGLNPEGLLREAFGGVHVISRDTLNDICAYAEREGREVFSIIDYYVDRCPDRLFKSFTLPDDRYWFDVGTPESLARANEYNKINEQR